MVTVMPQGAVRQRFLFDTNSIDEIEPASSVEEAPAPEPMISVAEHKKLLKAAEKAAFASGEAKAKKALGEQHQAAAQKELLALRERLEVALEDLETQMRAQEQNLVSMCFLIARRLCSHLIAREPLAEVVALLSECLTPLRKIPQILIEVPADDTGALEGMVASLVLKSSFEGKVHVVKSDNMTRGDCRIEWPDGGIIRDRRKTVEQIEMAIKSHFEARERASRTE
ncbi:flagellar assembly protein H [Pseudovibrio axinellae]|uniref:Flagellar assembly protein H n=1 Tax=Pseudovibrio axinellae TaxID=989403 RepID=A0A165XT19_9HYPH|nr:FliH/SctL family protein [Pseudovibrio axinellae]KZL18011.1 flagellar assembly protein H [Pseudovibrio axinellae]SER13587.1 flagellar assembly protein FliH [Pseudovibrio axinellae]